ncbi:hypothetical protein BHE74_00020666 [Ensete ventricosum]|nr:hypothetical protein BHE74_00020666 [Ensete ventricosum]RZR85254.1 hypothetical protein BHM03_00012216 [Ensete ventricosum]
MGPIGPFRITWSGLSVGFSTDNNCGPFLRFSCRVNPVGGPAHAVVSPHKIHVSCTCSGPHHSAPGGGCERSHLCRSSRSRDLRGATQRAVNFGRIYVTVSMTRTKEDPPTRLIGGQK